MIKRAREAGVLSSAQIGQLFTALLGQRRLQPPHAPIRSFVTSDRQFTTQAFFNLFIVLSLQFSPPHWKAPYSQTNPAWWREALSRVYLDTHTHTHVGFYGLRGLSIGVMVFILYKLYVLLPYTYPTPKLSPHRRRCISTFPPKNALCMIYKHFKLWGHWKCPHKSPSPCNTYVIPMSLYKFVSS